MKPLTTICLTTFIGACVGLAVALQSPPSQPSPVTYSGSILPYFPALHFYPTPCARGEGQRIVAIHAQEGEIHGCWVEVFNAFFISWDDGDYSSFPRSLITSPGTAS